MSINRADVLGRLRLLVGSMRSPPVAGLRDREIAPLQPGQAVDARVERQSPAGGHLVSVRGRLYEFKLPEGIHPGDRLRLVYLDAAPRPTFALLRIDRDAGSSGATLSDAGRLLAALREVRADSVAGSPLQSATPVFETAVPETQQAASLLRQALSLSGLFYESHQAQWLAGSRTTLQIRQEPQGKLAPWISTDVELTAAMPAAARVKDASPPHGAVADAAEPLPAAAANSGATVAGPEPIAPRTPAHPDTFPLIRQQLAVLESGQVTWRGEVWPGQPLEWQIGDAPDRQRPRTEAPGTWHTQLELQLPNLGKVLARMELGTPGAKLKLVTDCERNSTLLKSEAARLTGRLAATGISMIGFEVSHDVAQA